MENGGRREKGEGSIRGGLIAYKTVSVQQLAA